MLRLIILTIFIIESNVGFSQINVSEKVYPRIIFLSVDSVKDAIHYKANIDLDTLSDEVRLIHFSFRYTGKADLYISSQYTSDPHFICMFPKEPLLFGNLYSFDICFSFYKDSGIFKKMMGFRLSDDSWIDFTVKGWCLRPSVNLY